MFNIRFVGLFLAALLAFAYFLASRSVPPDFPDDPYGGGYSVNEELDTRTSENEEFRFDIHVFKTHTTNAYKNFIKENSVFPRTKSDLESEWKVSRFVDKRSQLTSYEVHYDNTIKITLSDDFGHKRWLELKPNKSLWHSKNVLEFDCRTTAPENWITYFGKHWCEPAS